MKRIGTTSLIVLLLLLVSATLSAQRGRRGGSGGGAGNAADAAPTLLTAYDSSEFGLKFPAPPDFSLFTPQNPGEFRQVFTERRIVYLVNLMGVNASVMVRYLPKATEADVAGFKRTAESNPPQSQLPEFKKIGVKTIKIGTAGDKDAVEFVYTAKDKDAVMTTRQVVFVHNGNGFIFNCSAPAKDFGTVDAKSFQKLFSSMEFK